MSTIARNRGRKSFRLINNSELLNITDQIYLILVLSMRYTFICDIYGNPNFFLYYLLIKKFAHNLLFIP